MIKLEKTSVMNFDNAIRGARNPMNSWEKSDSEFVEAENGYKEFRLGAADLKLLQSLVKSGSDHRKFMRQIFVSVDITAPLYWWKEFDTYKVGTVANSCSTMHKLTHKVFDLDDFSHDKLLSCMFDVLEDTICSLNTLRGIYINGSERHQPHDKQIWYSMIQLLPSSYNQLRTVTMNYENIFNMYHARKNHKLDEWREGFTEWVERLPFAKELITEVIE